MPPACGGAVGCWTGRRPRNGCRAVPPTAKRAASSETLGRPATLRRAAPRGLTAAAAADLGVLLRHRRNPRRHRGLAGRCAPRPRVRAAHRRVVPVHRRRRRPDQRTVDHRYRPPVSGDPVPRSRAARCRAARCRRADFPPCVPVPGARRRAPAALRSGRAPSRTAARGQGSLAGAALPARAAVGALVDPLGEVVWACVPRFDGDPAFCSLLRERTRDDDFGFLVVELLDCAKQEQQYLANTPILVTRLYDRAGGCVEITDFAPRFHQYGRMFCPMMLVRQIRRVAGNPRVRVRVRPARDYGRRRADITCGSNHIRYVGSALALRLTTDVAITAIVEENPFFLEHAVSLLLGPDETVQGAVADVGGRFLEETTFYWREWVRSLGIPFEWQEAVIRAAMTLELNVFEDTGAIIAAVTTSIPEAAGTGRTWDYLYCWLRDAYFVVNALNRLGATRTMERYLSYIVNLVAGAEDGRLQPVYGISGRAVPEEQEIDALPGYRGMGPVRIGNQASRQVQHDVYGSAILAATHG